MKIQLSDHFTYLRLIKFTVPSIVMMIVSSIYGIVDGMFVSNFAGKTAFAAINLIYPPFAIMGASGFMLGTGGTALVAKILGEGDKEKANRVFSMIIYVVAVLGIIFGTIGFLFVRPVAVFLGAEGQMVENCVVYARFLMPFMCCFMLQTTFQSFMITAERPRMGLVVTVAAGVANMVLDALFIAVFGWGLMGAAVATGISMTVGAAIPLCYFITKKNPRLHLGKTVFDGKALLNACTNGVSEMVSEVSGSVVVMLFNFQLIKFAGEDGVAAYGVITYLTYIFMGVFYGYSMGIAPVISYHYGAENHAELKNLFTKSLKLLGIVGAAIVAAAQLSARPLSAIFVAYDPQLQEMTVHGMRVFCLAFMISGITIFASGFFTALNNGLISAVMSFLRTLLFECSAVMILPIFFGIDGVWASIIVAELAALTFAIIFFVKYKNRYHYY
ncbi:MAG: MATE family efflux transporter [Firmicutes bacterium]|nr:MATE family efflux transporter [Bacillota bacterium]